MDTRHSEAQGSKRGMKPLAKRQPAPRGAQEKINTQKAPQFQTTKPPKNATNTTQQQLNNKRNQMLTADNRPHHYNEQILKQETQRDARIEDDTARNNSFCLETDSPPKEQKDKQSAEHRTATDTDSAASQINAKDPDKAGELDKRQHFDRQHRPDAQGLKSNEDRANPKQEDGHIPPDQPVSEHTTNMPIDTGDRPPKRILRPDDTKNADKVLQDLNKDKHAPPDKTLSHYSTPADPEHHTRQTDQAKTKTRPDRQPAQDAARAQEEATTESRAKRPAEQDHQACSQCDRQDPIGDARGASREATRTAQPDLQEARSPARQHSPNNHTRIPQRRQQESRR
ncbi:amidohydrolase family protein [Halomonas cupida]|uniref:Uncharacterized protein n=1 Tax=Halomonas cupida TaxID=44933 RepID=A0A1M7JKQ7_9GAMM|nr:hypothetical protein [Halomonas cupida]SHM53087.1 hypothetical protein SAMN05660971_03191 [Halomonas cupida]